MEVAYTRAPDAIALVEMLIVESLEVGASDIHLEQQKECLRIRLRIDGVLHSYPSVSRSLSSQVIARIKVLARLNSVEKRIPQDGKFVGTYHGREIDFRVSTFPSVFGEKAVIRILDAVLQYSNLEQLGMSKQLLEQYKALLAPTTGFIVVTGPTGSGKTTTLYATLSCLHQPGKNIVTLEDPVEYSIEGITQAQIFPEAGFTFAKGMRSLLRQDPDIAMVGEIRDAESARIAIEASLTGHLVFSTLHTQDAASVIVRLIDMGIEPYLLMASLTGVIAQRLARKLCVQCKKVVPVEGRDREAVPFDLGETRWIAVGCDQCHGSGYKGRIGIFELLVPTEAFHKRLSKTVNNAELKQVAITEGMVPLLADGKEKVQAGITSIEEFLRVLS